MKRIYFMRHAKAQRDLEQGSDFLRRLTSQGIQELHLLFERLEKYQIKPDLFLCSSATRTSQTAKEIARFYKFDENNILFSQELYHANVMEMHNIIKQLDSHCNNKMCNEVFLIGHNPTLKEICNFLGDMDIYSLPTSSVICLEFDVEKFSYLEKGAKFIFFEHIKPLKKKN